MTKQPNMSRYQRKTNIAVKTGTTVHKMQQEAKTLLQNLATKHKLKDCFKQILQQNYATTLLSKFKKTWPVRK